MNCEKGLWHRTWGTICMCCEARLSFAAPLWKPRKPLLAGDPSITVIYRYVQLRVTHVICGSGRSRWLPVLHPGCRRRCCKDRNAREWSCRACGKKPSGDPSRMQPQILLQPACCGTTRPHPSLQCLGRTHDNRLIVSYAVVERLASFLCSSVCCDLGFVTTCIGM